MSLKNQLKEKLLLTKEIANTSELAYKYCFDLIKSYFIKEIIDNELNRTFALKKIALEENGKTLLTLLNYYKLFEEHIDIISSKEKTTQNALVLVDELIEKFRTVTIELQTLAIFLENKLKERE